MWEEAKKIIPGGNQLLSKRSERFLPGLWPAYYNKAEGCEIWGIDGRHYYDFAQMGVGACVLGYADLDVNRAVISAVKAGSMSSLNCPEEVELAKMLIKMHPWSEMARFARTGGEACALAIRIGRSATKKSKVAFCGYHGWHDWYLAANLGDSSNLDGQLLPGLLPAGVPRELKDTIFPFNYNQPEDLKRIIDKHGADLGVIIMEPQRDAQPATGFLNQVRAMATKIGAVLIFDEVTSGFRMNYGGIHLLQGVNPDLAVFGKALGNGFPISAVIGRRQIMDAAQNSFISSTFWTEKIGYAAAIATLKKMKKYSIQKKLIKYGKLIGQGWAGLAQKHQVPVKVSGIPPLTHIQFLTENPLEAQTLYTQEMLERGYLLGAAVYTTYAYSEEIIAKFIADSDPAFEKIKQAIDSGNFKRYLKGEVIHAGFKRLA